VYASGNPTGGCDSCQTTSRISRVADGYSALVELRVYQLMQTLGPGLVSTITEFCGRHVLGCFMYAFDSKQFFLKRVAGYRVTPIVDNCCWS
jgi:hypothetical protein